MKDGDPLHRARKASLASAVRLIFRLGEIPSWSEKTGSVLGPPLPVTLVRATPVVGLRDAKIPDQQEGLP